MNTLRTLRELEKQTFLQCRELQSIPDTNKKKVTFKIIEHQNDLKGRNKFYKNLKKEMEKMNEKVN